MPSFDRPLVWLRAEVRTPPFSRAARLEAGHLLRLLQEGVTLGLPESRPMPTLGPRCHELRISDATISWRIIYRVDAEAVVVVDVFAKDSPRTPRRILERCRRRLRQYDVAAGKEGHREG